MPFIIEAAIFFKTRHLKGVLGNLIYICISLENDCKVETSLEKLSLY